MSIANAANRTYTGDQVSIGTYTADDTMPGYVDYTETSQLTPDTLKIDSVTTTTAGTVLVNFTYTQGDATVNGVGRVIANSTSGFIFSSTVLGGSVTFYVTNDAQTGTTAVVPREATAPVYVACYCPGTLIRTEAGDVLVEELREGDRLVTASGDVQPIRWIGTRSYEGRFFQANRSVWPIRIGAGALGDDAAGRAIPSRDLLVSPRHAMLVDGYLVPAELLVNDRTIRRDTGARQVSYYHIELPSHDAIWANDAASESFADDGSRGVFQNAASFVGLEPAPVADAPVFCAPRLEEGAALEAIRRRIDARAPLGSTMADQILAA